MPELGPTPSAAPPALVLTAHGTRSPTGQAALLALSDAVRAEAARSGAPWRCVRDAFVDVQSPTPATVVRELADEGVRSVIVPLLLSAGYHVRVDLQEAAATAPGTLVAAPLGPDDALVDILARRLADAGVTAEDGAAIVLASAGSSDERAQAHVDETARRLAARLGRPVTASHATAARPRTADVVAQLAAAGRTAAVATYLLAPGHFSRTLAGCGAEVVTAPLVPGSTPESVPSELVDLVLRRAQECADAHSCGPESWPHGPEGGHGISPCRDLTSRSVD